MQKTFRMLSYNIHKGFTPGNRRFVLSQMREAIREAKADLVFLQEVVGEQKKHAEKVAEWPTAAQFEYLADDVWLHHAYGKNAIYDAGHHGNAILSKYPILEWSNHEISTNFLEQRGMLHAVIDLGGILLHCICLHLGLTPTGRKVQLRRLCQKVQADVPTDPIIIAGDFNTWAKEASALLHSETGVKEVLPTRGQAATFPAAFPIVGVDRIYSRGIKITDLQVLSGSPWNRLSDHLPLLLDFELSRV